MKIIDAGIAVAIAVALVCGGSGGCMVAAHRVLRGKKIAALLVLAYAFVGSVFGAVGILGFRIMGYETTTEIAMLISFMFGVAGAIALAGANWSTRLVLRKFGIEAEITFKPIPKSDRK